MKYKIGIDIGGTNTDAVLVDENNHIVRTSKTQTTADIVSGFTTAISEICQGNESIMGVFAGTTHAINALLEVKNLTKIGIIRLAGYYPETIPACFSWRESCVHFERLN